MGGQVFLIFAGILFLAFVAVVGILGVIVWEVVAIGRERRAYDRALRTVRSSPEPGWKGIDPGQERVELEGL